MNEIVNQIEKEYLAKKIPEFRPGDTIKVYCKIIEGEKERVQVFQGVVIRKRGSGLRSTFTVRKVSFGIGVERIFLTNSPRISKIQVISKGKVRRARLYYLRKLRGKAAKVKLLKKESIPKSNPEAEVNAT